MSSVLMHNMVIFHEPDRLEFAVDGESLGLVKNDRAKNWFFNISSAPQVMKRGLMINAFQDDTTERVSAPYSAGFNRNQRRNT